MKYFAFVLILLLSAKFSNAQKPFVNFFDTAESIQKKHPENYIIPIKAIIKLKPDSADQFFSFWCQSMMTYYSFFGDYRSTLLYSDEWHNGNRGLIKEEAKCDTAFVKEHHLVNAEEYITSQASKHQVVMINEAHYFPANRAFVLSMLRRFYDTGYRYMPIETIGDSLINEKKYPDLNTGFYTKEPMYGEMIREAKRIGFKIIRYDYGLDKCDDKGKDGYYCDRFRDSLMAVHLNEIIKRDPQAKILVYAGHDHIHEGTTTSWKKMAQFFKEMTGINPYTVETTVQLEHFYPQMDHKEFVAVNRLSKISKPVIALKGDEPWHGDFVDVTVIFPKYLNKGSRPSYLSLDGRRKFYNVGGRGIKPGELVQAFYANEKPGQRVPADQFIAGNQNEGLYLFKGKYELEIKDDNGNLLRSTKIVVN